MKLKFFIIIIIIIINLLSINLFAKEFTLTWKKEEQSVKYSIEIAKDLDFKNILNSYEVSNNQLKLDLDIGVYYVRVCGFDKENIKTKYTPPRMIIIRYQGKQTIHQVEKNLYVPKDFAFTLDFLQKKQPKKALYYKTNGKKFIKYQNEKISFSVIKKYNLSYYYSEKKAEKDIHLMTIDVDNAAPDYKILVNDKAIDKEKPIKAKVNETIKIVGLDNGSGIKEILYKKSNNNIYYLYKDPIIVSNKEPFTLYFKLVDKVGNVSEVFVKKVIPY